jgi:hypothetical protein
MKKNMLFDMGRIIVMIYIISTMISCKSEYDRLVEKEISSGVEQDSLILGLKMGLTRQQYFEACAQLNKDSILQQGKGANAYYQVPLLPNEDSLKRKEVNFMGFFDSQKIVRGMQLSYNYISWSPWATQLHSDKLIEDLQKRIEEDYNGNKFIEVEIEGFKNKVLVKIDGNRRMLLYPLSNQEVRLKIEDIKYKLLMKEREKESKKS